jgi:hypothetical protein
MTTPGPPPSAAGPGRPLDAAQDEVIRQFLEEIAYAGYSTVKTRLALKDKVTDKMDLFKLFAIGSQVGNNPGRLVGKVVNPATGRTAQAVLVKYRIGISAQTQEDLTLPRIMQACAPLYYKFRERYEKGLQNQDFGVAIRPAMQSPALACYSDLPGWEPLREWLLRFGRAIKPVKESVEDSDRRTEQFRLIAVGNKRGDPFLNPELLNRPLHELLALLYN